MANFRELIDSTKSLLGHTKNKFNQGVVNQVREQVSELPIQDVINANKRTHMAREAIYNEVMPDYRDTLNAISDTDHINILTNNLGGQARLEVGLNTDGRGIYHNPRFTDSSYIIGDRRLASRSNANNPTNWKSTGIDTTELLNGINKSIESTGNNPVIYSGHDWLGQNGLKADPLIPSPEEVMNNAMKSNQSVPRQPTAKPSPNGNLNGNLNPAERWMQARINGNPKTYQHANDMMIQERSAAGLAAPLPEEIDALIYQRMLQLDDEALPFISPEVYEQINQHPVMGKASKRKTIRDLSQDQADYNGSRLTMVEKPVTVEDVVSEELGLNNWQKFGIASAVTVPVGIAINSWLNSDRERKEQLGMNVSYGQMPSSFQ